MEMGASPTLEKDISVRISFRLALLLAGFSVLACVLALLEPANDAVTSLLFYSPIVLLSAGIAVVAKRGHASLAGWLLSTLFFSVVFGATTLFGGVTRYSGFAWVLCILMAAATVGRRAASFFSVAVLVGAGALAWIESIGKLPEPLPGYDSVHNALIGISVVSLLSTWLLFQSLHRLEVALAQAKEREAERNRAHSALVQAQKLDVVGRLAGGVAHDFNNLLTAVLSSAGMLRITDDPDRREALLNEIEVATRKAGLLTQRLLTFGRPRDLVPRVIGLEPVLDELVPLLRRLIGDRVALDLRFDESARGSGIEIDPVAFEQIVLNLAINAREAMTHGSGTIPLSVEHRGDRLRLTVNDTGPGIPESERSRIFEPFYTTKESGTGLGLATVHSLVLDSGGTLSLESPAVGATFVLEWPVKKAVPATVPDRAPGKTRLGGQRALVVDDNELVLVATAASLRADGWDVRTAGSGNEALDLLKGEEFEVLLTDNAMHGLDGVELARRCLENSPRTVAIIMSGNTFEGALPEGAAFIAKPFDHQTLQSLIAERLEFRDKNSPEPV